VNVEAYRSLFEYNRWANARVWKCVMALSDDQFNEPSDYSFGSVQQQIVHTMDAESLWQKRLIGISPPAFLNPADYPLRSMIRAEWDIVDEDMVAWLDKLTEAKLEEDLEFRSINGDAIRHMPVWQALQHIVNHSTDHRAQTLAQIHRVGGPTVAQDLVFYTWEQQGQIAP
jgi:uncharacterized damage-inducible protein DinB